MRPARDGQPWTDAERESLRVARADPGLTNEDIADLLRRSVADVMREAYAIGLPRKNRVRGNVARIWTDADKEELASLWLVPGVKRRELAAHIGRTVAAMEQAAFRLGLPNRPRPAKPKPPPRVRVLKVVAPKLVPKKKPDMSAHIAELIRRGINPETARMLGR